MKNQYSSIRAIFTECRRTKTKPTNRTTQPISNRSESKPKTKVIARLLSKLNRLKTSLYPYEPWLRLRQLLKLR